VRTSKGGKELHKALKGDLVVHCSGANLYIKIWLGLNGLLKHSL